ncbi:MAG TPA: hypothetical protein DIT84_02900 [Clostridiales bacterium]|nr:hypothetical protein [Clostridiales bacterium]
MGRFGLERASELAQLALFALALAQYGLNLPVKTAKHLSVMLFEGFSAFFGEGGLAARQDEKGEKPRKGALTDGSGSAIAGSKNFTLSRFTILM